MSGPVSTTILLTGAANGIGRAAALALGSRGHRLGLIDRDGPALEVLTERLATSGATAAARVADVTDADCLVAAVNALEADVGPTEVLVACAGIGRLTILPDLDPDGLRATLEVNVVGVAHALAAVLPGMIARRHGHVVGVSSPAGFRGLPWMPAYSASKAALTVYLEGLRPGLKRRGITVTTVFPGFVRTALTRDAPFRRPPPMLEPEQAGAQLVRAVERRPRNLCFPLTTALGMHILHRLPDCVFDWLMDHAGPRALTVDF
jgi:short-subunit dehydrogenase